MDINHQRLFLPTISFQNLWIKSKACIFLKEKFCSLHNLVATAQLRRICTPGITLTAFIINLNLPDLQKLPEVLDVYQLQQNIKTLRQQQIVVSKKVYQLILDKHRACEEEIKKWASFQVCLENISIWDNILLWCHHACLRPRNLTIILLC